MGSGDHMGYHKGSKSGCPPCLTMSLASCSPCCCLGSSALQCEMGLVPYSRSAPCPGSSLGGTWDLVCLRTVLSPDSSGTLSLSKIEILTAVSAPFHMTLPSLCLALNIAFLYLDMMSTLLALLYDLQPGRKVPLVA